MAQVESTMRRVVSVMGVASLVVRSLPYYDPGGHGLPTEAPPQRIVTIALSFAALAFRPEAGVGVPITWPVFDGTNRHFRARCVEAASPKALNRAI
jgi:hypothetical protein